MHRSYIRVSLSLASLICLLPSTYFIGEKYNRLKKAHGGERPARPDTQTLDLLAVETKAQIAPLPREALARDVQEPAGASGQNVHLEKTAAKVAVEHGVDERTVRRSADYSRAVNAIAEVAGDAARSHILSGE